MTLFENRERKRTIKNQVKEGYQKELVNKGLFEDENDLDEDQWSVGDHSSDHESNKEQIKLSSPSNSKNDEKDIILIHDDPEKSQTRIAIPLPIKTKVKRYKVIIDPNVMYDDKIHAGCEISTVLKSVSSYESERFPEDINEEYEIQDNSKNNNNSVSDQMEVDVDQDWSIIKIHKRNCSDKSEESESKTKVKMSNEYVQYEPEYAKFLYEIVRSEFLQLESECEEEKDTKKK